MAKLPPSNKRRLVSPVSSKPTDASTGSHDGRWWAKDNAASRATALWDTATVLDSYSRPRHMLDAYYVGLYEGQSPWWLGSVGMQSQPTPASIDYRGARMTTNLGKSVIDTISALLAKNIDELRVLTSGGTWSQATRARGLTKYLSGAFSAMGYHREKQRAFIDGCRAHKAAVKFWKDPRFQRVRCGRVRPYTLLWNDLEGEHPANLYQKEPFPRQTAMAWFPKLADLIEKAPQSVNPVNPACRRPTGLSQHADMIDIIEGWHISPDPETPGVHMMVIQGQRGVVELVNEPWKHQFFPFADFCWDDADEGWGGIPLMQSLKGYQAEINYRLRMERVARARSIQKIFVEAGSEIIEDHLLGDEIRGVVKYKGTAPTYSAPNAVGNDHLAWLQWYFDKAFGEAGISLLNSHGEKPAGLDSGQALREYNDITATRQVVKGQRLERQTELAGMIVIALTKELAEEVGDLKVLGEQQGHRTYEEVRWSDVEMEIDEITLRTFAVSALPTHAVGRIQALTEMIKGGLLPQDEIANGLGLKLLNFPDLEKIISLQTANVELAQRQADSALYEGEYIGPEPYQDLGLLRATAQKEYLHALTLRGVPDKHLQLLERLCSQANSMLKKATAPPPAPAAPALPPGAPPGMQPPPGMQLPEIQPGVNMVQPALPSATPARTEAPLQQ